MIWLVIAIFIAGMVLVILVVLKLTSGVNQQLNSITQQVNERLKEASQAMLDTHKTVGDRLDKANTVFGDVQKSLGRLEETHKHIIDISKDISSLQDLLRAPKFRGEMGETLLGKLLEDILPKENIKLQHHFKTGDIVDAAIVVGQNLICIDAKFPLENFRKFAEATAEEEKNSYYRVFVRDVKKRVDEVASKYILTDEGTFDFALMYIPAEAVYYHISKDDELSSYTKAKKVVFVSPNTFYAYLQAILYGLRGINIQKNIQKVFAELSRMQMEFSKFQEDFNTLGKHIMGADTKYKDAAKKLEQFNDRLITVIQKPQLE